MSLRVSDHLAELARREAAGPTWIEFSVPGEPRPAQPAVLVARGRVRTEAVAKAWRETVRIYAMAAVGRARWASTRDSHYHLSLWAYLGDARVVDVDNLAKCALDGLKGVLFPDDRQVVRLLVEKVIDRGDPRLVIEVLRLPPLTA